MLTRTGWRTAWRSYLAVSLVLIVSLGAAVAALTGASRSRTAFSRLRAETNATDARVAFEGIAQDPAAAVARVRRLPGVQSAAAEGLMFVTPDPDKLFPDYTFYGYAPVSARARAGLDQPVVTQGRAADSSRSDEVTINRQLAKATHIRVGANMTLQLMSEELVQKLFAGKDPGDSPTTPVVVKVVGLARSPADFSRYQGVVFLTPAFYQRYHDAVRVNHSIDVRLTPQARRALAAGRAPSNQGDLEVLPSLFADTKATDDGLGTISAALRLLGLAIATAGALAVALAILRSTRIVLRDHATLSALGCTRRQLLQIALFSAAPWLVGGLVVGVLVGVRASPRTLVGLARNADPAPHRVLLDGPVLLMAVAASALVVVVATALSAVRVWTERSIALPRVRRGLSLRRPLPPILGARYAVGGAPDRMGRTSRVALVAAVLGTAAAVAALTVSASIHRLQVDPRLDGVGVSRVAGGGEDVAQFDQALPVLEHDSRVKQLVGVHVVFGIRANGHEISTLAYDLRRGSLEVSTVGGRAPRSAGEVAVGPATLQQLHKSVGDRLVLRTEKTTATYRIVGATLFPEGDFEHDKGLAMTVGAADRLVGNAHDAGSIHEVAYTWKDGVDAGRADAELRHQGLLVQTNDTGLTPAVVTNLGQVERLPRLLAAFLGLIALVSVGHALSVTVRLRKRDLATLLSLGTTRRVNAWTIGFEALYLLSVALLAGIPLGIGAGRLVWTPIARRAHVVVLTAVPFSWLVIAVGAAVVATAVVSVVPSWRAGRLRPAQILRAE